MASYFFFTNPDLGRFFVKRFVGSCGIFWSPSDSAVGGQLQGKELSQPNGGQCDLDESEWRHGKHES